MVGCRAFDPSDGFAQDVEINCLTAALIRGALVNAAGEARKGPRSWEASYTDDR